MIRAAFELEADTVYREKYVNMGAQPPTQRNGCEELNDFPVRLIVGGVQDVSEPACVLV
jgi:hypothetical protein